MALTIKNLGIGSLSDQVSVILPGSTTKSTLVKSIILVNTSAATVTVNIWLRVADPKSTGLFQRLVSPKNVSIAPNAQIVLDAEITLLYTNGGIPAANTADSLVAQASTASVVDYVINGLERDI